MLYRPILMLSLLCASLGVRAQQSGEAPDPDRPALPNIAPQEVEIRGSLEINLPALRRQPLIGFNPPPRVREVPTDRRPWVEDYKQEQSDLPPSPLLQPSPPQLAALGGGDPLNGQFGAGIGRFYNRFARGRAAAVLSDPVAAFARLDYRGISGYEPLPEDEPGVTYGDDNLEAAAGLHIATGAVVARVQGTGFYDRYQSFAIPNPTFGTAVAPENPQLELRGGTAGLDLRSRAASRTSAALALEVGTLTWALGPDAPDRRLAELAGGLDREEQRFEAEASLGRQLGAQALGAGFRFGTARYDEEGAATFVSAGAALRLRSGTGAFTLWAGPRYLASTADDDGTRRTSGPPGVTRRVGYLSADAELDLRPSPATHLYARNRPHVEANHLRALLEVNPYLLGQPDVRPTLIPVDAEAGVRLFAGPARITGFASYLTSPNYRFFEHAGLGAERYRRGLSAVRYEEATIWRVGGDVSAVLPLGLNITAGLAYRNGTLDAASDSLAQASEDVSIPYFSPLAGEASLTYAFAGQRALLQLHSTFEGARYRDRAETRRLSPYLDLDLLATYAITEYLDLLGRIDNVSSSRERWDYAVQPPLTVGIGLQVRW